MKTSWFIGLCLLVALIGGGAFFVKSFNETKRAELQRQTQEAKLKTKEAELAKQEAETKAQEAATREATAKQRIAEAERDKAKSKQEAALLEAENLKTKKEADLAAEKKALAEKEAALAETEKAQAQKEAADAQAEELKAKTALEEVALKRAEVEQRKADAELASKEAAKRITEAALAKSENELKIAEANALAEHDRKLRLYHRAGTSRAEMLALQRAERLLALDEAGQLNLDATTEDQPEVSQTEVEGNPAETPTETNIVVAVDWRKGQKQVTPAGEKVKQNWDKLTQQAEANQKRRTRMYIDSFGKMFEAAKQQGRQEDIAYYRKSLVTLVPGYVDEFIALLDEARKNNQSQIEDQYSTWLMEVVPDWQRVAVMVQLLEHDEAYYSKKLAGRVAQDEFVKAFRKRYDEIRRDKGDHDEREQRMQHLLKVLSTYVPDYEHSAEWK